MPWFRKYFMLMDENKGGDGGGGAGGGEGDKGAKEMADLKATNAALEARLAKLEGKDTKDKGGAGGNDEADLAAKAAKDRQDNETKAKHEKSLESALHFNIAGAEFVKLNEKLLPSTVGSLFTQSEKEKYGSAIEKANAIKAGIVSEFFAVQKNLDMLTGPQKIELADFLSLTKNAKEARVENVYAMIFEPTLETIRKIERAKQLNNGQKNETDSEKAYADRMMKISKAHYLGDKNVT